MRAFLPYVAGAVVLAVVATVWLARHGRLAEPVPLVAGASAPDVAIYRCSPHADRLLRLFFAAQVHPVCTSVALERVLSGERPTLTVVEDSIAHHSAGIDRSTRPTFPVAIDRDVIDSFLLYDPYMVQHLPRLIEPISVEVEGLLAHAPRFAAPIEKALLQRDVHQMAAIILTAAGRADAPAPQRARLSALAGRLRLLLASLALSAQELSAVSMATPGPGFTAINAWNLADDYLPARVFSEDADWYEVPYSGTPPEHFTTFGGRSFIRIFIKVPGWPAQAVQDRWDAIVAELGPRGVHNGRSGHLPAGTETLLVRSAGLLMEDGTVAASGLVEEVLMRNFRHEAHAFDPASSDLRGTHLRIYKLSRERRLAGPGCGLRRLRDEDMSFFGFFSDAPDHRHSYNDGLTTVANNCISCHSELHYGLNTIFSLGRRRPLPGAGRVVFDGWLERDEAPGRFRLTRQERGQAPDAPSRR